MCVRMGIADAEMERDHGWNDDEEGEEDKQTQQNEQQMMMMIMRRRRRVVECCWLSWARLDQSTRIG